MKRILVRDEHAAAIDRLSKASGKQPHEVFAQMVNRAHEEAFGIPLPGHAQVGAGKPNHDSERLAQQADNHAAIAELGKEDPAAKSEAFERLGNPDDASTSSSSSSSSDDAPYSKRKGANANPLRKWAAAGRSSK